MRAVIYLLLTSLKNRILSLRKKPLQLVCLIICIAAFIMMIAAYSFAGTDGDFSKAGDIRIIYAVIAAIGLLFGYVAIASGLSSGGTFFSMSDVAFLFVAPVSTKKVLLYGIVKQMGTTLITAVFILFQIPNLKMNFNINSGDIINIFVIYAVIIFFSQVVSMSLYIFTNGNERRKNIVKGAAVILLAAVAAAVIIEYRQSGSVPESIFNVVSSRAFGFIPMAGWAVAFVKAGVDGNILFYVISIGFFVAVSAAVIIIMTAGKADYYEDVLSSTEKAFARLQTAKDGQHVGVISDKKVKIKEKDIGIRHGDGASVMFYKHMLEMRRAQRIPFISMYTVIAAAAAGIITAVNGEIYVCYAILAMLIYFQFFMVAMGKLSVELIRPYIYLMPQPPFKKLVYASMTSILKPFFDGVIIFGVMAVVKRSDVVMLFFQMLAYGFSGMVFVSFTIICQRFLGGQPSKILSVFIGIGVFVVMISPGIAASVIAFMLLPNALKCMCLLPYILLCIMWSVLSFFICRNLLEHMAK